MCKARRDRISSLSCLISLTYVPPFHLQFPSNTHPARIRHCLHKPLHSPSSIHPHGLPRRKTPPSNPTLPPPNPKHHLSIDPNRDPPPFHPQRPPKHPPPNPRPHPPTIPPTPHFPPPLPSLPPHAPIPSNPETFNPHAHTLHNLLPIPRLSRPRILPRHRPPILDHGAKIRVSTPRNPRLANTYGKFRPESHLPAPQVPKPNNGFSKS